MTFASKSQAIGHVLCLTIREIKCGFSGPSCDVYDKDRTGYNQASFSNTYRALVKDFDVKIFMSSTFV